MIKQFTLVIVSFFMTGKNRAQLSTASPQVSTFTIEAPQLQDSKKIWVYLPKNYSSSNKKYSVIYMHDAQNLFDANTSYAGEWNVDEKLEGWSFICSYSVKQFSYYVYIREDLKLDNAPDLQTGFGVKMSLKIKTTPKI
ncbi:alpha/beta hydrolase-fold protein [Flavobacterium sp. W22_SRS_FP1]|uniref:alpha/beta hydrolase-fold protein n=1 Tax=Flavobacterium sp. W22_SRS_FP1 TaxID=3240276 RepID=UPI003F92FA5D